VSETVWQVLLLLTVAAVILEAFVLVGILRQVGTILLQVGPAQYGEVEEGPAVGTQVDADALETEAPSVLLFVSPTCQFCKPVSNALPTLRRRYRGLRFVPVVIADEGPTKHRYAAGLGDGARVDLDHLYEQWGVPGTPFAVGVRGGRVRTAGVVNNLPQLETMADVMLRPEEPDRVPSASPNSGHHHDELPIVERGSTRAEEDDHATALPD
jgi:hypothetical protein